MSRWQPPRPDELEVSVFGPGRGECIVVHVPDDPPRWFVVDSLGATVGGRKSAVAHLYLNRLGVRDLWGVFLTHWHLDHTDAAGDLLQAFAHSLKVVGLPPAFSRRELASFLASRLPDEATFAEVRDLTAVMDELAKNSAIHPVLLNDGTVLAQNSMWRLDAIAPSMSDVQHQLQTLAAAVVGTAIKGKYDVNACCAVLVLEVGSTRVLLGSDLANGETPAHG
jgi:ribonuclease BN (tRNA processing enzyme)